MKNTKYLIFCIFLVISNSLKSQDILDRYLEIAAQNSPSLKANFFDYQAALQVIPQSSSLPDPQVSFAYFIQAVETRLGPQTFKFSATQMFPWFGTLKTMENTAAYAAKEKYELFEQSKSELYYNVRSVYYELYLIDKAIEITEGKIELVKSFKDLALTKSESGSGRLVNVLKSEMLIADMENRLNLLKDNRNLEILKFYNLLNTQEEIEIILPDTLWNSDFVLSKETALDSIIQGNHQLAILEMKGIKLNYNEILAEKSGKPEISLGIDYIVNGTYDNPSLSSSMNGRDAIIFPRIGFSLPLYRNKYKAFVKEAIFLQEANKEKHNDQSNILENLFEKAFNEYTDADRRIAHYHKQIQFAGKAMTLLEVEYANSGNNFEELLDMEADLLEYELELEKARSDKMAALAFINFLMGN